MPWPVESDYFEAIQNPRYAFSDPELKAGNPPIGPNGLPKYGITGSFASVYQMICPSHRWAVRCFLRDFGDNERRYNAISQHLIAANLPCTVSFQYLSQGIRVKGRWYPLLKMEWLDAEPLDIYVGRHVHQPSVIQGLIRQWIELSASLKKAQIAHGDLQHGNVLVCNGSLRLIDYDGMFVPMLGGMTSHEQGHRNYQHPKRTGTDFNLSVDHFSSWVIFISLSALSVEPSLWKRLNGGDEALLFRRDDFIHPDQSKVLQALELSGNSALRALSAHFRSLLYTPLAQMPSLDGMPVPSTVIPAKPSSGLPEWLDAQVITPAVEPLNKPAPPETRSAVANAEWIFTHLVREQPKATALTTVRLVWERLGLVVTGMLIAGVAVLVPLHLLVAWAVAGIALGLTTVYMLFLLLRFRALPVVAEKREVATRLQQSRQQVKKIDSAIAGIQNEKLKLQLPLTKLDEEYKSVPKQLGTALQELQKRNSSALNDVQERRQGLDRKEASEMKKIRDKKQQTVDSYIYQRNSVDRAEAEELNNMLAPLRQQHISQFLLAASVADANITGFGPKMKGRLLGMGIICAAHIDARVYRVAGIGPQKAAALSAWRQSVEQQAMYTAPTSVPQYQADAIRSRRATQRRQLQQQIEEANAAETRDLRAVMENFVRYRRQLDDEETALKIDHQRRASVIQDDFAARKVRLVNEFNSLKARTDTHRQHLDKQMGELNRESFRLGLESHQLERAYHRYSDVAFHRFAMRAVLFR